MARMTDKQIDGGIERVATTYTKAKMLAQQVGLAVLEHGSETGDVSKLTKLVEAIGTDAHKSAFMAWCAAYSPVRFNGDGIAKLVKGWSADGFNVAGAEAEPFYTFEKAITAKTKQITMEDIVAFLEGYGERVGKQIEAGKAESTDNVVMFTSVTMKLAEQAKALIAEERASRPEVATETLAA